MLNSLNHLVKDLSVLSLYCECCADTVLLRLNQFFSWHRARYLYVITKKDYTEPTITSFVEPAGLLENNDRSIRPVFKIVNSIGIKSGLILKQSL